MSYVECKTQEELDAAAARGDVIVLRRNSSAVLWDNASVKAYGCSFVRAYGGTVNAGPNVMVMVHSDRVKVTGGIVHRAKNPTTAAEWCAHHGVTVENGVAILFKGVKSDVRSPHGFSYLSGTRPVALDWDGGVKECGGGLHFSPTPRHTHEFISKPTHYVACPVALADISVHPEGDYPEKVKARGCCAPVWEVDIDGNRIGQ